MCFRFAAALTASLFQALASNLYQFIRTPPLVICALSLHYFLMRKKFDYLYTISRLFIKKKKSLHSVSRAQEYIMSAEVSLNSQQQQKKGSETAKCPAYIKDRKRQEEQELWRKGVTKIFCAQITCCYPSSSKFSMRGKVPYS